MPSPPLSVLHVDTAVEWRGGQRQLELLLRARPQDRWAGVPDSPLARRVGPPALALRPGGDPRNLWHLRALLRGPGPPALVAAHTPHALGLALLVGAPTVAHRRVDFAPSGVWKYRRARRVVAVSEAVRAVLLRAGVPSGAVVVVHDGVEPPPDAPLPAELAWLGALPRPLFLAVGALVAHKGHGVLVEAMAGLPGSLVIAGEGPLRGALEAQVATLGLRGRVHLPGTVEPIGGLLRLADVFVHPSLEEGLGQVVIEAMAVGVRVVASAAGGVPEVLGGAGLLVPPGDAAALVEAARRALALERGRGVEAAARWSVARMVEGTSAVYEDAAVTFRYDAER